MNFSRALPPQRLLEAELGPPNGLRLPTFTGSGKQIQISASVMEAELTPITYFYVQRRSKTETPARGKIRMSGPISVRAVERQHRHRGRALQNKNRRMPMAL